MALDEGLAMVRCGGHRVIAWDFPEDRIVQRAFGFTGRKTIGAVGVIDDELELEDELDDDEEVGSIESLRFAERFEPTPRPAPSPVRTYET